MTSISNKKYWLYCVPGIFLTLASALALDLKHGYGVAWGVAWGVVNGVTVLYLNHKKII